jgi:hypothetical protein
MAPSGRGPISRVGSVFGAKREDEVKRNYQRVSVLSLIVQWVTRATHNGGTFMVKIIVRLVCAATTLAAVFCFDVPASRAFGDAPWCAVIGIGNGEVYWDCQYRTIEECVPNVIAGNRGFCNVNPYSAPAASTAAARARHQKKYVQQH